MRSRPPMDIPNEEQITEAILASKLAGETDAELNQRIDGTCRLSDTDLAAYGVFKPADPEPLDDVPAIRFAPVPVKRRHDGWTVERQQAFIAALATGGCVSEACAEVGITARSAYRLREHPKGA